MATPTTHLERLRTVAEAATAGAWTYDGRLADAVFSESEDETVVGESDAGIWLDPPNGEYIATFDPPTVLALLDVAAEADRFVGFEQLGDGPMKAALARLREVAP